MFPDTDTELINSFLEETHGDLNLTISILVELNKSSNDNTPSDILNPTVHNNTNKTNYWHPCRISSEFQPFTARINSPNNFDTMSTFKEMNCIVKGKVKLYEREIFSDEIHSGNKRVVIDYPSKPGIHAQDRKHRHKTKKERKKKKILYSEKKIGIKKKTNLTELLKFTIICILHS